MNETEAPGPIDDDELTAIALAADPDAPLPADARPIDELLVPTGAPLLPSWYMPAPALAHRIHGWRLTATRVTVGAVVATFVFITSLGLCNTYGDLLR